MSEFAELVSSFEKHFCARHSSSAQAHAEQIITIATDAGETSTWQLLLTALEPWREKLGSPRFRTIRLASGENALLQLDMPECSAALFPEINAALQNFADLTRSDYFFGAGSVLAKPPELMVFDMDSTLIPIEVIDELAAHAGNRQAVSAITEQAMRGELDFTASLRKRVALLRGLSVEVIDSVGDNLRPNPGIVELAELARANNCHLAIASGGFEPFAKRLQSRLGFWTIAANRLEVSGGRLTGRVEGDIVDGQLKRQLLLRWCDELNISTQRCIAMGDGANDLPMMGAAGLGVAYKAKPKVAAAAAARIRYCSADLLAAVVGWI